MTRLRNANDSADIVRRQRGSNPTIAILGRGPSAAYAWTACRNVGITPDVYGPQGAAPKGAFWLYWLPWGVDRRLDRDPIKVIGLGSGKMYVKKQWGREDIASSFPGPDDPLDRSGYDPTRGLAMLWEGVEDITVGNNYGMIDDEAVSAIARSYDLVLQTFPRTRLPEGAETVRIPIAWRRQDDPRSENTVVYDGQPGNVVRSSWLWGVEAHELVPKMGDGSEASKELLAMWQEAGYTIEWRKDIPPYVKVGYLPTQAENIVYLGRYARWARKALSHEAYELTLRAVHMWKLRRHA